MADQAPKVLISIVNWNGSAYTIPCLESLAHLDYANFQAVVIDNASADDSVSRIQSAFPSLDLIVSPDNVGYAAGHRLALDKARQNGAELIWILNNDTMVRPDTLTHLVDAYRRRGDGLFGSVPVDAADPSRIGMVAWAVDDRGKPQYLREEAVSWGASYANSMGDLRERRVANISGSSFLIPLAVINHYGFMDESFFMYAEEVDYCFRLVRQGIAVFVVPRSVVTHILKGSSKQSEMIQVIVEYYRTRNRLLMIKKYRGYREFLVHARQTMRRNGGTRRWLRARGSRERFSMSTARYYRGLGVWHALLSRRGKTIAPEDFLN